MYIGICEFDCWSKWIYTILHMYWWLLMYFRYAYIIESSLCNALRIRNVMSHAWYSKLESLASPCRVQAELQQSLKLCSSCQPRLALRRSLEGVTILNQWLSGKATEQLGQSSKARLTVTDIILHMSSNSGLTREQWKQQWQRSSGFDPASSGKTSPRFKDCRRAL